jgi:Uma2 family endonuclease
MAVTGRHLTLDEFLLLPEEKPALEYADGKVTRKVSPQARHGTLQFWMAGRLHVPGRFAAMTETRVTFAGRSYVPDVITVAVDRLPLDARGEVQDELSFAPDVAVEIRSPGQSLREQVAKCRWYVANGVRVAPLVDPIARNVRLFRPGGEQGPLVGDDVIDLSDVIPGRRFAVAELFAALRPAVRREP